MLRCSSPTVCLAFGVWAASVQLAAEPARPLPADPGMMQPVVNLQYEASHGNVSAMLKLAEQRLQNDPMDAYYWFGQAAQRDSTEGSYQMGLMHLRRIAPASDLNMARRFLLVAATRGHTKARIELATLYADPQHPFADHELALRELNELYAAGHHEVSGSLALVLLASADARTHAARIEALARQSLNYKDPRGLRALALVAERGYVAAADYAKASDLIMRASRAGLDVTDDVQRIKTYAVSPRLGDAPVYAMRVATFVGQVEDAGGKPVSLPEGLAHIKAWAIDSSFFKHATHLFGAFAPDGRIAEMRYDLVFESPQQSSDLLATLKERYGLYDPRRTPEGGAEYRFVIASMQVVYEEFPITPPRMVPNENGDGTSVLAPAIQTAALRFQFGPQFGVLLASLSEEQRYAQVKGTVFAL